MLKALAERARRREALIAAAGNYIELVSRRLPVVAAAVVGSVARGDFNVLAERNRRALRVHLGPDVKSGLRKLAELVKQVLA